MFNEEKRSLIEALSQPSTFERAMNRLREFLRSDKIDDKTKTELKQIELLASINRKLSDQEYQNRRTDSVLPVVSDYIVRTIDKTNLVAGDSFTWEFKGDAVMFVDSDAAVYDSVGDAEPANSTTGEFSLMFDSKLTTTNYIYGKLYKRRYNKITVTYIPAAFNAVEDRQYLHIVMFNNVTHGDIETLPFARYVGPTTWEDSVTHKKDRVNEQAQVNCCNGAVFVQRELPASFEWTIPASLSTNVIGNHTVIAAGGAGTNHRIAAIGFSCITANVTIRIGYGGAWYWYLDNVGSSIISFPYPHWLLPANTALVVNVTAAVWQRFSVMYRTE